MGGETNRYNSQTLISLESTEQRPIQPQVPKVWERGYRVHTSLVPRPFCGKRWSECNQEKGLAWIYGCIPAVSTAEGRMPVNVQEALYTVMSYRSSL